MSSQNINNLIGFLAKKSLFNIASKKKAANQQKSDEKSQIFSRMIRQTQKKQSKSQISQFNVFRDNSQINLGKKDFGQSQVIYFSPRAVSDIGVKFKPENRFKASKGINHLIKTTNSSSTNLAKKQTTNVLNHSNSKVLNPQTYNFSKSPRNTNDMQRNFDKTPKKRASIIQVRHQNVKSSAKTFQSARIQSAQCLQDFSFKLKNQILSTNQKIEAFNQKMYKSLTSQLENLKGKVLQIVFSAFKQAQKTIKQYMHEQQSALASDLLTMKKLLQKHYEKVQTLKVDIYGNNWKKAAGQLLTSQLQQKVQLILRQSKNLQAKPWQLQQIGKSQVSSLHNSLKQVFNFQRQKIRQNQNNFSKMKKITL